MVCMHPMHLSTQEMKSQVVSKSGIPVGKLKVHSEILLSPYSTNICKQRNLWVLGKQLPNKILNMHYSMPKYEMTRKYVYYNFKTF